MHGKHGMTLSHLALRRAQDMQLLGARWLDRMRGVDITEELQDDAMPFPRRAL